MTLKNAINIDFTKSFYLMNHLYDVISYNIKLALKVEQRTFTEKFWYHSKNLKILRIILEWLSVLKSLNLLLIR